MNRKKRNITIRNVLVIATISLILILFKTCKKAPAPELPYGVWEAIATGVRESPDHLKAQAERLASGKDDEKIYRFVRDNFQTVPGALFAYRGNHINHGVAAAYRSGFATRFEKALILEELLSRAGYESSIQYKALDEEFRKNWSYPIRKIPSFEPSINISSLNRLDHLSTRSLAQEFTLDKEKMHFLISEVDKHWQEKQWKVQEANWSYVNRDDYAVIYTKEEIQYVANPSREENKVYKLGEEKWRAYKKEDYIKKEIPKVKISLQASYDDNKYTPFTVAEGEWTIDDIIGKDVQLSFKVLGPPDIVMQSEVSDIETFVPCIDILDPYQPDWIDSMHISGDVLTTRGDVVSKKKALELFNSVLNIPSKNINSVAKLNIEKIKLSDFPTVTIEARVEDENGNPVMGLSEEELNFLVNGEKVTHRMVRNQVRPPRVMFLYDESRSIPDNYALGKDFFDLFDSLVETCRSVNPDTEINVACLGKGDQMSGKLSGFTSDVAFLKDYMKRYRTGSSNNWTGMASGCKQEADVLILLSDADGSQVADDFMLQRYTECVPAIVLGIESNWTKSEQFNALANATKGKAFRIAARNENQKTVPNGDSINMALDYIKQFIRETGNERYLIELDVEGEEVPFLDIKMGDNMGLGLMDSITQIPFPSGGIGRLGNNAITGLYLELEYKQQKHHVHLAGVPLGSTSRSHPITQAMINECNNALLGDYILNIDVAKPLKANLLEDLCQHYLQLRHVEELLAIEEPSEFFKAMQKMQWKPTHKGKYPLVSSLHSNDTDYMPTSLMANFYSVAADSMGVYKSNIYQIPFFHVSSLDSIEGKNLHKNYGYQTLKMSAVISENMTEKTFDILEMNELKAHTVAKKGDINFRTVNRLAGNESNKTEIIKAPQKITPATKSVAYLPADIQHDNFLFQRENGYLEIMNRHGSAGTSERNYTLQRDQKFINNEGLWNKSLGAKMETWGDLEGNKLALIQVGVAALDNMTELENPQILMDKLKSKIKAYALSELEYEKENFLDNGSEDHFLELYNIAKNNLNNCSFLKS